MKLVPKRRFKGFSGEWEVQRLGDVSSITAGGDVDATQISDKGNYPVIANALNSEGIIGYYNNNYRIKAPAVTVTGRGDIGHASARKINFTPVVRLLAIKSDHNVDFLANTINGLRIFSESTGVPQLTVPQLGNYEITFPSIEEQQKIGLLFKKIDKRIDSQEAKLKKLRAMKQAYLHEMFPAEGESVPKRRFAGFSGEWEEKNLGDITNINTGDSDVKDADISGKYPFFIRSENVQRSNKYTFDGEAILIPGEGRLGEIFHYIKGKFDYHQRVYKISGFDEKIDGKFIFFSMHKSFKEHAMRYTVKSTVNSLRLPMLTEYIVNIPPLEEQIKIAEFFSHLDEKTAMQEAKVEKLKAMKKAYLEEMFV